MEGRWGAFSPFPLFVFINFNCLSGIREIQFVYPLKQQRQRAKSGQRNFSQNVCNSLPQNYIGAEIMIGWIFILYKTQTHIFSIWEWLGYLINKITLARITRVQDPKWPTKGLCFLSKATASLCFKLSGDHTELAWTSLSQPSNGQGRNDYSHFTDEPTEVQVATDTKKSGLWAQDFTMALQLKWFTKVNR